MQLLKLPRRLVRTEGTNIVGLFPGARFGTPADDMSVVVAHWDTVETSPGFNDNGSGMAALLEIARALSLNKVLTFK